MTIEKQGNEFFVQYDDGSESRGSLSTVLEPFADELYELFGERFFFRKEREFDIADTQCDVEEQFGLELTSAEAYTVHDLFVNQVYACASGCEYEFYRAALRAIGKEVD